MQRAEQVTERVQKLRVFERNQMTLALQSQRKCMRDEYNETRIGKV
jgi:hypothetical protein